MNACCCLNPQKFRNLNSVTKLGLVMCTVGLGFGAGSKLLRARGMELRWFCFLSAAFAVSDLCCAALDKLGKSDSVRKVVSCSVPAATRALELSWGPSWGSGVKGAPMAAWVPRLENQNLHRTSLPLASCCCFFSMGSSVYSS